MEDRNRVQVPEVIRRYLDAHDRRDTEVALATFAPDATVDDEERHFRGPDEIRTFLTTAGAEFTYTRTFVDAQSVDDAWVIHNRLEGDFPGGVADLRYQFVLIDGLIAQLVIAP